MALVFARVAALLSFVAIAHARTFKCDQVWSSASPNNSASQCFTNTSHVVSVVTDSDHLPFLVLALIPLVFFIIVLFCCPIVTCARYCCKCCGSYMRRPGTVCCGGEEWDLMSEIEKQRAYPASSIRNTKCMACLNFLLGIGCLVVGIVGFVQFSSSYNNLFTQLKVVLAYVNTSSVAIRPLMTINSTGQLIPPLTADIFTNIDTITANISSSVDSGKSSIDSYVQNFYGGGAFLAIVPIAFLLLTNMIAFCKVRTCLPCFNSLCHYVFIILASLLSTVFLALAFVVTDACGERDLFLSNPNAPGLISLAGVPLCNNTLPLGTIRSQITSVITTQANSACTNMLTFCNQSPLYNPFLPADVFQCANLVNATTDCPDFGAAYTQGNSLVLKTGASVVTQCLNGSTVISPCTLSACAQTCTDANTKSVASSASTALGYANNGQIAYDRYVSPLLSCNNLYARAFSPMTDCMPFANSLYLLGSSLLGYTVVLTSGLCVIWRGQKRFFDPIEDGETAPYE